MWNGKKKAITFSFDDGVTQDIRLIEILNKYGLKATFNLNSGFFGNVWSLPVNGVEVSHIKVQAKEVKDIYQGHEVAAHTITHPFLPDLDEAEIIRQVEEDRKTLSALCGYDVMGMAYPCGGQNNDDRVAKIIQENTGVRYSRTTVSTYAFDLQENLYRFNPTVWYGDARFESLIDEFLALETDKPKLFYVWGHAYELDAGVPSWEKFEELCKKLSGKEDIFYGTNKQVFLDK